MEALFPNSKIERLNEVIYKIETKTEAINKALKNSATIKYVISDPLIFNRSVLLENKESVSNIIDRLDMAHLKSSFKVRMLQIGVRDKLAISEIIEGKVGAIIKQKFSSIRVDLNNPDYELLILAWDNSAAMGWLKGEIKYSSINDRAPKNSPYFGGGAMKPLLSRICVNLLQPLSAIVLDPFCGHGGMLREIADMGSFAIGIEISTRVIRQASFNNRFHKYEDMINLIQADSLYPPFRNAGINSIVTDPPYARQTTTIGRDRDELLYDWFNILDGSMKIVITTPTEMLIDTPISWQVDIDTEDYVHKSLTRRIRRMNNYET